MGISINKQSLNPGTTLSHGDDPTTYRTGGGGGSTGRQYHLPIGAG